MKQNLAVHFSVHCSLETYHHITSMPTMLGVRGGGGMQFLLQPGNSNLKKMLILRYFY